MADETVSLTLAADAHKLNDALANARTSLQALSSPVASLAGQFTALGRSISDSLVVAPIKAAKEALDSLIPSASSVQAGVNALESSIGGLAKTISSGGATSGGNSVSALLLGGGALGVAAAGAMKLFQIVGETNDRLKTMVELADRISVGLNFIQELKFAANRAGVKDEVFTSGLDKAADRLNDLNSAALKDTEIGKLIEANNLKYKDQEGHLVNLNEHLKDNNINLKEYLEIVSQIAERGKNFQDKAYVLDLAGLGKEWVNVLGQGPEKLRETMAEAQKVGAVLNGSTLREMVERQKEWNEQVFILATKIESVLLPALGAVNRILGSLKQDWADTVDMWSGRIDKLGKVASSFAETFGKDYKEGDFMRSLAEKGLADRRDFKEKEEKETEDRYAPKGLDEQPDAGFLHMPYWGKDDQDNAEFMLMTFKQVTEAKEKLATVNQKLGGRIPFGAGRWDESGALPQQEKGGPELEKPETAEAAHERVRTAMEKQNAAIRESQLQFQESSQLISRNASLFIISEDQKTASLLKAVTVRTSAEIAAEDEKLKVRGLKPQEIQRIEDQKILILKKSALEDSKITDEETQRWAKEWQGALGQVQGAWDSQLAGLLARTTTWHNAMKAIMRSLVLDWIKEFEKAGLSRLAAGLAQAGIGGLQGGVGGAAFGGLFGNAQQTANTTALTGLTAALTANTAALLGETTASTAQTAATVSETSATLAETIATNFNSMMKAIGIPGFAVGAWEIPSAMAGILHPGEMVVPAGPAAALRSGGGGSSFHFSPQVSSIDERGVQAMLHQFAGQFAKTVSSYQRKNPSSFR